LVIKIGIRNLNFQQQQHKILMTLLNSVSWVEESLWL